jgi:RNA polymerase sigma factor (sigma-70 family)
VSVPTDDDVMRYHRYAWHLAYRYIRLFPSSLYDDDDLYQIAMRGLLAMYAQHGTDVHRSFCFRAMSSEVQDELTKVRRRRKRVEQVPFDDFENSPGTDDPAQTAIHHEEIRISQGMICRLSALERQVLVMDVRGWRLGHLSEALGKPYKVVDNALQRGRQKLRKWTKALEVTA